MNSDHWQELWREQPPSLPLRDKDRLLRHVRDVQSEWDREWNEGDRPSWNTPFIIAFIGLASDRVWPGWAFLLVVILGLVFASMFFRIQRLRLERGFGQTLLERLARGEALLRYRIWWCDLMLIFFPLLAVALAAVVHGRNGSISTAIAVGSVALGLFGWFAVWSWRRNRALLWSRLVWIASIRRELTRSDSDELS